MNIMTRQEILEHKIPRRVILVAVTDYTSLGGDLYRHEINALLKYRRSLSSPIEFVTESTVFPSSVEQVWDRPREFCFSANIPSSLSPFDGDALTEDGWFINEEEVNRYALVAGRFI